MHKLCVALAIGNGLALPLQVGRDAPLTEFELNGIAADDSSTDKQALAAQAHQREMLKEQVRAMGMPEQDVEAPPGYCERLCDAVYVPSCKNLENAQDRDYAGQTGAEICSSSYVQRDGGFKLCVPQPLTNICHIETRPVGPQAGFCPEAKWYGFFNANAENWAGRDKFCCDLNPTKYASYCGSGATFTPPFSPPPPIAPPDAPSPPPPPRCAGEDEQCKAPPFVHGLLQRHPPYTGPTCCTQPEAPSPSPSPSP